MHAITITNGEASFAFNGENGDPWHRLGTDVRGLGTKEQMLDASRTNWRTEEAEVFIKAADGSFIPVTTHKATVRNVAELTEDGVSLTTKQLGIVGAGYEPEHNADAVDFALECVGATGGDAVIDTMGSLYDDRQFFVCIDLGSIVLDADGTRDLIKRYFIVANAHDGSKSLTAYETDTRVVCSNTQEWSERRAQRVYRIRHTKNKDTYKDEALVALGVAAKARDAFVELAHGMMQADGGPNVLDRVIKELWTPPTAADGQRKQDNWTERRDAMQRLLKADTNEGGFGRSGWTVYGTVVEYLDHGRGRSDSTSRALATANPSGDVARMKAKAAELVLASA